MTDGKVTEANADEMQIHDLVHSFRGYLMLAGYDHAQIAEAMLTSGGALLASAKGRETTVQVLTDFVDSLANGFAIIQ